MKKYGIFFTCVVTAFHRAGNPCIMEGTLIIVLLLQGGDGSELQRGGSLVNFFKIGEGQTCFIRNRGRVSFFWQGKNYSLSLS